MSNKARKIKGILPDTYGLNSIAICLMIYDWERPVDSSWIDLIDNIFTDFDGEPAEGTGHLDEKNSHGVYRRVRNRLGEFLDTAGKESNFSIRVRGPAIQDDDGFMPSDVSISCGRSRNRLIGASFAVKEHLVCSADDLVIRIGKAIFEVSGACYGHAWDFPAAFGPESYLVSLGTIPRGHKYNSNEDYSTRITRWRDNIWHRKLRPSRGYFREVYPINFLLDTHLNMPFRDKPLSEFMEANGDLGSFEFNEKMYRWDVSKENLNEVREALEQSGLILSSEAEPLQIN